MRYLLDTDIAVSWLRRNERARQRVEEAIEDGVGLSFVSLAELYEGVYLSRDPQGSEAQLDRLLRGLTVVPLDRETSSIFGRERAR
jgi:predicted nucleic acid-binding protein